MLNVQDKNRKIRLIVIRPANFALAAAETKFILFVCSETRYFLPPKIRKSQSKYMNNEH